MRSVTLTLILLLLAACAGVPSTAPLIHSEVGFAFDRNSEIGSFADGFADPKSGRRVTIDDPVRVASVSKMVTAIGVMKLVDEGRLDLNSDVSNWLGWTLRNPNFPNQPITISMLLSHTSSVREHDDDYVIPLGGSLRTVMADPKNWDKKHGPADHYFSYVNLNYPIIGSIIERVTNERFDLWMKRNVPCDLQRWKLGENGSLFAPQGGLRISARGLARIGQMLLNHGTLDGIQILSPQAVAMLMRQVWRFDGTNGQIDDGFYCSSGNGTHELPNRLPGCADEIGTGGAILVGHAGDAYGMKSGLWIDQERGMGVAYFVTGVADVAPKAPGSAYTSAEVQAFRRAYGLLPR